MLIAGEIEENFKYKDEKKRDVMISDKKKHLHRGSRLFDTVHMVVVSKCDVCGEEEENDFTPISPVDKDSNYIVCAQHEYPVISDLLGVFCPYCEVEKAIQKEVHKV